jgi:LysM repeat protein
MMPDHFGGSHAASRVRPPWGAALSALLALALLTQAALPLHVGAMTSGVEAPPVGAPAPAPARPLPQSTATATATPSPSPTLTNAQRLAELDAQITVAWNAANWPLVLNLIQQVIAIDPNHDDIQGKKYQAHLSYGWQLLTEGRCTESLAQFRLALLVRPDGEEAALGLQMVARYCDIPVPTSTFTPQPQPSVAPSLTTTPQAVSAPFQYKVVKGDTLYSLARRYNTTVQSIMQINGMMDYCLREGATIWIPASGQPPAGPLVHIVQPGETLYSLATQYRTTVWAIMAINNMKSSAIWAYQALFIPSASQPGPIIHIVQPGETLYTIATRYNTTVAMLMLANGLQTYNIRVYQRIVIPPQGWEGWPPMPVWTGPGPGECGRGSYQVQRGDTLYSIARRYGVTVSALMAANKLTSTTIHVGASLCIP